MQKPIVLFDKFLNHELSDQEREMLKTWVDESDEHREAFKKHIQTFDVQAAERTDPEEAYQRFLTAVTHQVPQRKTRKFIYRYAAIFIALLTLGWLAQYFVKGNNENIPESIIVEENPLYKEQIILKLADGSTEEIATGTNSFVKDKQGNVIASTDKGVLELNTTNTISNALNEITIPYGTTYKIQLSDSTIVWLNAGSTLKFPQNFALASGHRKVFLEGEAFFDVTKDEQKPFLVHTKDLQIKVLGTQFNVSSYASDKAIKTTLVEGAVDVFETTNPNNQLRLSPNNQAAYHRNRQSFDKLVVDTNIYTDWMQNKLSINHMEFSEILTKLERRHNVRIVNNAQHLNKEIYNGEFENESIEVILNTIALSTPFTYHIENNSITISK